MRTKSINKQTTPHEKSQRVPLQHINILFLELIFPPKNQRPLIVSTTVSLSDPRFILWIVQFFEFLGYIITARVYKGEKTI